MRLYTRKETGRFDLCDLSRVETVVHVYARVNDDEPQPPRRGLTLHKIDGLADGEYDPEEIALYIRDEMNSTLYSSEKESKLAFADWIEANAKSLLDGARRHEIARLEKEIAERQVRLSTLTSLLERSE